MIRTRSKQFGKGSGVAMDRSGNASNPAYLSEAETPEELPFREDSRLKRVLLGLAGRQSTANALNQYVQARRIDAEFAAKDRENVMKMQSDLEEKRHKLDLERDKAREELQRETEKGKEARILAEKEKTLEAAGQGDIAALISGGVENIPPTIKGELSRYFEEPGSKASAISNLLESKYGPQILRATGLTNAIATEGVRAQNIANQRDISASGAFIRQPFANQKGITVMPGEQTITTTPLMTKPAFKDPTTGKEIIPAEYKESQKITHGPPTIRQGQLTQDEIDRYSKMTEPSVTPMTSAEESPWTSDENRVQSGGIVVPTKPSPPSNLEAVDSYGTPPVMNNLRGPSPINRSPNVLLELLRKIFKEQGQAIPGVSPSNFMP